MRASECQEEAYSKVQLLLLCSYRSPIHFLLRDTHASCAAAHSQSLMLTCWKTCRERGRLKNWRSLVQFWHWQNENTLVALEQHTNAWDTHKYLIVITYSQISLVLIFSTRLPLEWLPLLLLSRCYCRWKLFIWLCGMRQSRKKDITGQGSNKNTHVRREAHTRTLSWIENVRAKITTIGIKGLIINSWNSYFPSGRFMCSSSSALFLPLLVEDILWPEFVWPSSIDSRTGLLTDTVLPAVDNLWTM